jgi:hypothetical protein
MPKREKSLPRVYGNPFQQGIEEIELPTPELESESTEDIASFALGHIQELAARLKHVCSDKKATGPEKRIVCALLLHTVGDATALINELAIEFQVPFRGIAEESTHFPCLFPSTPESLEGLQKFIWDNLNLGKRIGLKIRPGPGRKTFSQKTWVNNLLIGYILEVYSGPPLIAELQLPPKVARELRLRFKPPPLARKNARQCLDVIWQLLLRDIPEPEKHPRLRQLGGRPSKAHNVRSTIKAKLGVYLERMLTDQAVHK